MKNILLSLLILSSSLIYSTNTTTNVNNQEEIQSLHQQKIAQRMQALKEERERSKDIANQRHSFDEWKVTNGVIGLLVGVPFFFSSIEGVLFLLMCPDKILSRITSSSATSSPIKNFLTNRFLLLSLCTALSASSVWIIKKSISNLYQGFYGTEDTMEY
jgi:hypothetical protein